MRLDHVALQVKNPAQAANWYKEKFDADILYCDKTWSIVQLDNIKIAFVVKTQHPAHIAFEVDVFKTSDKVKQHRDGSSSIYKRDPWGNTIEYIKYSSEKDSLNENKRQSIWRRVRRKLQYWRPCYVDGRFCVESPFRKARKNKLWPFDSKKDKSSRSKKSLFC